MQAKYQRTLRACFTGYVVQAVTNIFISLLFLTFQSQYGIPLEKITLLITVNFVLQLLVDLAAAFFVDQIGYRAAAVMAHGFSAGGLFLLPILPEMMDPFTGLLLAVCCYAVGGGLLEVVISPMVEACPNDHKDRTMSLLHAFYCWGCVGVIALSSLYFHFFGVANWKTLAFLWAALPLYNGLVFLKTPIAPLLPEGQKAMTFGQLFRQGWFWVFLVLMVCAGASEHTISQWSSAFAEKTLGIPKTVGDLLAPALFALMMGLARSFYGRFGGRVSLDKMMLGSTGLCAAAFLLIGLSASPAAGLTGIALSGIGAGILWPGTFSKAAAALPAGGTAMFAILALAGDLGCSAGPTVAGFIAGAAGDQLRSGILAAVIFPVIMTSLLFIVQKKKT